MTSVNNKHLMKAPPLEENIEQLNFDINHRLRASVAAIIGAINIMQEISNGELNEVVLSIIKESTKELNIVTEEIVLELTEILVEIKEKH